VVNQLLAKMDGIYSLDNVLLIGITNRIDLIDEALLRPGRFEVKVEIGLPDLQGRLEILSIHTDELQRNGLLDRDVSLEGLAVMTENFTGAELEGLVKDAVSHALNRRQQPGEHSSALSVPMEMVTKGDFLSALAEASPSFGATQGIGRLLATRSSIDLTNDGPIWESLSGQMESIIGELAKLGSTERCDTMGVLLLGGQSVGKTSLAVHMAVKSGYPFVRMIGPIDLIGLSELDKCRHILAAFRDAGKSAQSVLILDDLEGMIEFSELGPKYSNAVLQTVISLIKHQQGADRALAVIVTMDDEVFRSFPSLGRSFHMTLRVPHLDRKGV